MELKSITNKQKRDNHIAEGTAYSILVIISISHFLNDMIQSVVPAIYPIIKENFSLTFAEIGLITFVKKCKIHFFICLCSKILSIPLVM